MNKKKVVVQDKIETVNKWLPVKLTKDQILERASKAANLVAQRADLESEKSAKNREYSEKFKEIDGEMSKLSKAVAAGEESQNVVCEVRRSYLEKRVITIRKDTYEIVDDRKMYENEMQGDLPFPADALDHLDENGTEDSEVKEVETGPL